MSCEDLHLRRDGSGQFFIPRVGFRVFLFCSGRVSGFWIFPRVKEFWLRVQVFFLNHTYLSLIGGLVPLKVRVRWHGSGKNCLGLRKNYYGLAGVLQNIAWVGSG